MRALGPLSCALSLGLLTGCVGFETAEVMIESGAARLSLSTLASPPCPEVEGVARFIVGDSVGPFSSLGGQARDGAEIVYDFCDEAIAMAPPPSRTARLVIGVDSAHHPVRIEVPWPEERRIWSDDDLTGLGPGDTIEVRWTPAEAGTPHLWFEDAEGRRIHHPTILTSEPGRATARIDEVRLPDWSLWGSSLYEGVPTVCEGVLTCRVRELWEDRLGP